MNDTILYGNLPDGGPLYTETDLSRLPVEPWNTFSSMLYIVAALFWIWRVWGQWRSYPLLAVAGPVLLIGGIGGTLYHGLRSSYLLLSMDVVPIYVLMYGAAGWLWQRLGVRAGVAAAVLAALFGLDCLQWYGLGLPEQVRQSLSYAVMGLTILLPLGAVLVRERGQAGLWVLAGVAAYAAALTWRVLDGAEPPLLPMGTHFLWHGCGCAGTLCLAEYLYRLHTLPHRA